MDAGEASNEQMIDDGSRDRLIVDQASARWSPEAAKFVPFERVPMRRT